MSSSKSRDIPHNCYYCGGEVETTHRGIGWTVDCIHGHPLAFLDDDNWTECETFSEIYFYFFKKACKTEREAIIAHNRKRLYIIAEKICHRLMLWWLVKRHNDED